MWVQYTYTQGLPNLGILAFSEKVRLLSLDVPLCRSLPKDVDDNFIIAIIFRQPPSTFQVAKKHN